MVPGSNNLRTKWNLKITPFYCKSMPVEEKRRFTDEAIRRVTETIDEYVKEYYNSK